MNDTLIERFYKGAAAIADAADAEVAALRRDLAAARAECEEQARLVGMGSEREARLLAERDEARNELRVARETIERAQEIHAVMGEGWTRDVEERDALAEALRDIYEVWAGSEGFTPQTAPEGYQQRLIEQMRDIARAALGQREDAA